MIVASVLRLIGGITVFLLGLRLIGSIEKLAGNRLNALMRKMTSNRFVACGGGALVTAIAQSSVATNMVAISFVNTGAVSLAGACATVIGTNFGTTMTAQLVSLKFVGGFDVTALGALIALIGFFLGTRSGELSKNLGDVMLGFGLIFIGIEITASSVEIFKKFEWFTNIFLVKSPPILLLNGFFVTAICQSSSVVTSMLVVLASGSVIDFTSGAYLIMGANIGTCVPVIIASAKKSLAAEQVAWFNVFFNVFGSALYFVLFMIFGDKLAALFRWASPSAARQLANFHSFFNLSVGVIVLALLTPFVKVTEFLVSGKKPSARKKISKLRSVGGQSL